MIYLYTAPPGTGKTCWVVKQLVDKWIPDPANDGRKIYSNIAGLKIEGIHPLPDGGDFRECDDGSIIIIDEPQEIPHYNSDSRGVNPVAKALSKHRHRGFDIHFITQDPSLLHKYVLKNVFLHYYLWRPAQRKAIEIFTFARAIVSPNKNDFKNAYDKVWWRFEEYYLQFYKSTVVNTSKKMGSSKRNSTIVTFSIFILIIAYFMYPAIRNAMASNDVEENQNEQQLNEQQLITEQFQPVQPVQLVQPVQPVEQKELLPTQEELQIKENNRIAMVAVFKDKCKAYNPYGHTLELTYDECIAASNQSIEPTYLTDNIRQQDYEMPQLSQPEINYQANQFIP